MTRTSDSGNTWQAVFDVAAAVWRFSDNGDENQSAGGIAAP